jgi:hypothetical protein
MGGDFLPRIESPFCGSGGISRLRQIGIHSDLSCFALILAVSKARRKSEVPNPHLPPPIPKPSHLLRQGDQEDVCVFVRAIE